MTPLSPSAGSLPGRWLGSVISRCTKAHYPEVACDGQSYRRQVSSFKIVKKYLHKRLALALGGQGALVRQHVPPGSRVLWLFTGKRNFGDANLELSGRALLKGRGVRIDLLTLPNLHALFKEDDVFENVFQDVREVRPGDYDFILLSEYNHRSIRLKRRFFRCLPFACLFGYFDGPARNQSCFSHAAINDIFRLQLTSEQVLAAAKPYLCTSEATKASVASLIPQEPYVTVSIGGIDPFRSYRHWPEFLRLLDECDSAGVPKTVVLVGSDNGLDMLEKIQAEHYPRLRVRSLIGQLSILQTREVIAQARAFVGCDGGLMHVAHSTGTRSVSLFAVTEPWQYWLTERCGSLPIQSGSDVSAIEPVRILESLQEIGSAAVPA
ncbi:glycosyltransferase family 9 protein [Ramlibacter humi]|nr:glycosyltransferase family 9 protein [Ramlibacter humi]